MDENFKKGARKSAYTAQGLKILAKLALGGMAAGFCNGLLGAGGGVVLVLFLSRIAKNDAEGRRSIFANALCVMIPISFFTLMRYGGPVKFSALTLSPEFVIGAAAGGIAGGIALGLIKGDSARRIFAVFTVISGILMIAR